MKTAEINTSAEMQTVVAEARSQESTAQLETAEMENEVAQLEQILREAEVTSQQKEEAERAGKETKERIGEATG